MRPKNIFIPIIVCYNQMNSDVSEYLMLHKLAIYIKYVIPQNINYIKEKTHIIIVCDHK
jgi:hypothetical protein